MAIPRKGTTRRGLPRLAHRVHRHGLAPRCSAATIDLHSGGEDNIFPHHECEIAQSCGVTGADRFARHWFHIRFLMVEGQKMSKSKGTFFTARDLMDKGHSPAATSAAPTPTSGLELINPLRRPTTALQRLGPALQDRALLREHAVLGVLELNYDSAGVEPSAAVEIDARALAPR
jgi:hypothetical protein